METSTSSSSSLKSWKYDVFLSCQGQDTRRNFTSHLYQALTRAELRTFLDHPTLQREESLVISLTRAIEASKTSIIIFSKNYAKSRWCLDELVKIMECRRTLGQIVVPVFYDVDPSDVRKQTGTFATAFLKHEQQFDEVKEKLQPWRDALTEAANLSGFDVGNADWDDAKSITEIVANIIKVLRQSTAVGIQSRVHAVGIHSRVQEISNYLDVGGSDDVRIIGIWGMGGLGKTMIAKAIFNKYQDTFEGKSFLANVREEKLVDLQNTLLSDVVRSGIIKVRRVDEGTEDIKRRLSNLRVLVIVDGVDSVKQLEALAIKFYSFGPGSRIIITTRDQHLLKILKANRIYHLPAMNKEEALELLCWHANNYPSKEFLQVPRGVVDYCGGLPLALEVLGSYLSGTSISEWKGKLEKFKSHHSMEILNRLKIRFDELADDDLKAIFLDVSCFFAGMNKDYVMKILDGCDLYPEIGISVLQERCLVSTNDDFTLVMHDLLRDMGRYIVHAESLDDPGKRSRLWHHNDVIDVLRNESGTEAIQGLTLDLQESDKNSFSTEAFRNMHNLRLLKLNYVKLTGSYNNLPNELRWLCWHGFPLDVIPEDFDHPNIVVIDLSYSKLTRVWEDSDLLLEKLKFLNLSHSHNLTRSPDFSKTPNLEILILKDCKNLKAIPALPTNLEILEADECIALEKMPDFSEMSRMRELHLNHSPKLSEILGLDKALNSNSMTSIHMEGCTNLTASFKEAILQGWSARGNGGLCLPENEIPSWFTPVDPQGEIVVPQSFGCDLKALTVCIIYSSGDSQSGGSLRIRVANYTQNTVFLSYPMRATVITCHENYLWLGHLSNNKLNVKGGDKINVGAHFVGPATTDDIHVRVKEIGINLEKEKLIKEYALNSQSMPYSNERKEEGSHKAEHSDDSSHENESCKRLRSDPSVQRNVEEETYEIMKKKIQKIPHLIQAMSVSTNSSSVAQQAVPENEVEQVELLAAVEDLYGGVVVDVTEPMDSAVFASLLQASISQWRQKGKKGFWIKLPIERSNLVDAAVKEGFRYHHAESDYLMLVRWISETCDFLPANASHRVGIGAFVMNSKREVLVVQELSGRFSNTGVWKMPTGVVNEGEDVCEAAVREVKEETGIDTEFVEVLAFRQSHKSFFRKSDLFIVCMLTPKSFDIQEQNLKIEAAQWMPVADYAAQPFVKKNKLFDYIAKICLAKSDKNYVGFTALGTTTSSGKRSYLYYNNRDMENLLATGDPQ